MTVERLETKHVLSAMVFSKVVDTKRELIGWGLFIADLESVGNVARLFEGAGLEVGAVLIRLWPSEGERGGLEMLTRERESRERATGIAILDGGLALLL